jgi:Tol biopolymer transport system component
MNFFKLVCLCSLSILVLLIASCDEENPLTTDSGYNLPYRDTIIFRTPEPGITLSYIDGTGARTICDTMVVFDLSWSPNKRKIIFVGKTTTYLSTNQGIYLVDLKDYLPVRILPKENKVQCATYSPNMQYIAYSVRGDTLGYKIKLLNLLNDQIEDLTDWINRYIYTLSWSPDSKNILMDDGYVVNIDTKELEVLFSYSPIIQNPNWSPNGNKVAFCGITPDDRTNICIYDLVSRQIKVLHGNDGGQYHTTWSKDGSQLIFDQQIIEYGEPRKTYLCKINVDGTNFVQITDGSHWEFDPCWYK